MAPALKGVNERLHVPFFDTLQLTVVLCKENVDHVRNILLVETVEGLGFPEELLAVLEKNGVELVVARTASDVAELIESNERTVFLLNGMTDDASELPMVHRLDEFDTPAGRFENLVKPLLEAGKSCLRIYNIR